jgi:hypothetical protein
LQLSNCNSGKKAKAELKNMKNSTAADQLQYAWDRDYNPKGIKN